MILDVIKKLEIFIWPKPYLEPNQASTKNFFAKISSMFCSTLGQTL